MPPALLPPLLRVLGRLGARRGPFDPGALRAEAAREPAHVGGASRPRGGRAHAPGAARRPRTVRGLPDRGHRPADAAGVEGLARRGVPGEPEAARALRARVRRPREARRLAGPPRARGAL